MTITKTLRKQINQAVRDCVRGANPLAEVGHRGEAWGNNALLWTDDDDLGDLDRLANVKTITDDPAHPGHAVLDLYVTTGIGVNNRELETNVYIAIRDGVVVAATDDSRALDRKLDALTPAFPRGAGWLAPFDSVESTSATGRFGIREMF